MKKNKDPATAMTLHLPCGYKLLKPQKDVSEICDPSCDDTNIEKHWFSYRTEFTQHM